MIITLRWEKWIRTSLLILFLIIPKHAEAFCFNEAGSYYNISPKLLWAIATVESSLNQSAIGRNKDSYDVGVMQINSRWKKILGKDRWEQIWIPCENVKTGAWILAQCIEKIGYNWKAVGCYNSTIPSKQIQYAWKVAAALKTAK